MKKPQMWSGECFRNGGPGGTKRWKPSHDAGAVDREKRWKWGAMTPRLSAVTVNGDDKHNPGAWPGIPEPHMAEPAREAPSLETLPIRMLHPPSHRRKLSARR